MPDMLVPYVNKDGVTHQVVITEQAQQAAEAAQRWSEVDPSITNLLTRAAAKGVNSLDPVSAQRKAEAERQIRMNPPKPATVVNLHPWPLTFGAGNPKLRGITVPPCLPGQICAFHVIRRRNILDWQYDEDGLLEFKAVRPIDLAAEFIREFGNRDAYGGGVLIYEGDTAPDKAAEVECYDPTGRIMTVSKHGVENDGEQDVAVVYQVPIKKDFQELLDKARKQRNQYYMDRVRKADADYKRPDGRGKSLVTEVHMKMAEMLHGEGIIPIMPDWNLQTSLEAGLADDSCPACGMARKLDSFRCGCGHILDAFEAYQEGAIEWGHASMETMTLAELEEAEKIRVSRAEKTAILRRPLKDAKAAVEARVEKEAEQGEQPPTD